MYLQLYKAVLMLQFVTIQINDLQLCFHVLPLVYPTNLTSEVLPQTIREVWIRKFCFVFCLQHGFVQNYSNMQCIMVEYVST